MQKRNDELHHFKSGGLTTTQNALKNYLIDFIDNFECAIDACHSQTNAVKKVRRDKIYNKINEVDFYVIFLHRYKRASLAKNNDWTRKIALCCIPAKNHRMARTCRISVALLVFIMSHI